MIEFPVKLVCDLCGAENTGKGRLSRRVDWKGREFYQDMGPEIEILSDDGLLWRFNINGGCYCSDHHPEDIPRP